MEGARPRGRPKKTWKEIVEKDCKACTLKRQDAMDHSRWRKQIGMMCVCVFIHITDSS